MHVSRILPAIALLASSWSAGCSKNEAAPVNTIPVTLAELEQRLQAVKATTPEFPVVVRGDNLTQYQGVMEVLDTLGRLGITQIGLATKPAK